MVLSARRFHLMPFVGRDCTEFSFKVGYDAWEKDIGVKIIKLLALIGFGYQFKNGTVGATEEAAEYI